MNFYIGTVINPKDDESAEYLKAGLLAVEETEAGSRIRDLLPLEPGVDKYGTQMTRRNTTDFGAALLLPGFFDMHFHWVQDDVREMPKDSLLEWLEKYTFPAEMRFAKRSYARARAREFFRKLVAHGTVGGACYSSIHEHALDAAMTHARGHFVIGNVLMNVHSPPALTQSDEDAVAVTARLIDRHGTRHCFTPRFAITTTPTVMRAGARLADGAGCFKQTHLSETPQEIDFVLSIYRKLPGFERVSSYTEIYEKSGMLGKRSLMGHGIHLSPKELKVLGRTKTTLVHCPTSNAPIKELGLGSGLFDFRKVERAKVRWALGSDIGGGPFLSMFDVMRSFVDQNKRACVPGATYVKALYRATLAGAEILNLGRRAGSLARGKEATFIVVPLAGLKLPDDPETLLKRVIEPHRRNRAKYAELVMAVYLNGQRQR
jgi:guanine deaminase